MVEKHPMENEKTEQLGQYRRQNTGKAMTSDSGFKVADDEQSLRAGRRGPSLFQDTHFYRKQSHFNRERIPEKVVHARGFGVHGEFTVTKSMSHVTCADFLQEVGTTTPVFVRFSNFVGSKGSKDTAIDVRGFATKFYTRDGNYDSLALSFGVFIIKDAMKFADLVHAIKPNPATDVPQAAAAHDRLWDWVVNNQESAHMVMWLMSMKGRPRSWRMMEGWPVNTYRFIDAHGGSTWVRFVWKPVLGVHGLTLDEANIIGGVDPDFHRHDIIEAVQQGAYPQYHLGVQLIADGDESAYDFDILDDTKIWPEEVVPVELVGTMTLNKLVENSFAETEQSSFDPASLVPGIDVSHDPVMQGRSFAYRDTDYHRLGTANINDIPINRPLSEVAHNLRDGAVQHRIDVDEITYHRNSLAKNTPRETAVHDGGYDRHATPVEGQVTRELPSESFDDHFSQARLFFNSMSPVEKDDMVASFCYHLGKVKSRSVRQQTVEMFANVDTGLAGELADCIGVERSSIDHVEMSETSPSLSATTTTYGPQTMRVGVLVGEDFDEDQVRATLDALEQAGAFVHIISDRLGSRSGKQGTKLEVDETFLTSHPTLFDAYYILGGTSHQQKLFEQEVSEFFTQAYKFFKPLGVARSGEAYTNLSDDNDPSGVVFASQSSNFPEAFVSAVGTQRFWERR